MIKKQLSLSILLTILLSMVVINTMAHDIEVANADGKTIYYNYINNNTELQVVYKGNAYSHGNDEYSGDIVIPEEVTYMGRTRKVTSIGNNAFRVCNSLYSVTIPNSVTSIGSSAFRDCGYLKSVTIPNNLTSIENYTFEDCYCLESVNIPNSVTSIGKSAFAECYGLTSVVIPSSVTSIGDKAFYNCQDLASVTISDGVKSIGAYAFYYCIGLTSLTIPNSVTSIYGYAFYQCMNLTTVTIGNGVTNIYDHAFYQCKNLTTVTMGNSLKKIESWAFLDCKSLNKVIVKDIGAWCGIEFDGYDSNPLYYAHHLYSDEDTKINELVIPEGTTNIEEYAFVCCNITAVTIPKSMKSIGGVAFYGCESLKKVIIKDIGAWCGIYLGSYGGYNNPLYFAHHLYSDEDTEIKDLVIPDGTTYIEAHAFEGCSYLTSVTFCNSLLGINGGAFKNCSSLTSLTIGDNVSIIGWGAFENCNGLKSVTIGSGVKTIDKYAFNFTNNKGELVEITSLNSNPTNIDEEAFNSELYPNASLYVPIGTMEKYKACVGWQKFTFMEEKDVTGVSPIQRNKDTAEKARYTLDGKLLNQPRKGLNIIQMSDGTAKKVVIK